MPPTAAAAGSPPDPGDHQPRRFQVRSHVVIERPLDAVWAEFAQMDHPAWSDHPEGKGPTRRVGPLTGLAVGAAWMGLLPAGNGTGVRGVVYSEVKEVVPNHSATTETVVTGSFELKETLQFLQHPGGGVLVECSSWIDTVPLSESRADRLRYNLQRLQGGYLTRARDWQPSSGYRPNVIHPEAKDLSNAG